MLSKKKSKVPGWSQTTRLYSVPQVELFILFFFPEGLNRECSFLCQPVYFNGIFNDHNISCQSYNNLSSFLLTSHKECDVTCTNQHLFKSESDDS